MDDRSIAHILKSESIDMGGLQVKQAFPTHRVDQISPFLLLHHFGPYSFTPGDKTFEVAPHPHRGFEPVTFLYQGGLRHKDSRGNEGTLAAGDIQWMTAGRGIIHRESVSESFLQNGGILEGIQLWINLPRAKKMVQPRYQNIESHLIPEVRREGGKVSLKVVAGSYAGKTGPAMTFTPMLIMQLKIQAGFATRVEVPAGFNCSLYLIRGQLASINGFIYEPTTLLHYNKDGSAVWMKAVKEAEILFLGGAPIEEPVARWGPYVMNSQTEILEAMRDYQQGKMGFYID